MICLCVVLILIILLYTLNLNGTENYMNPQCKKRILPYKYKYTDSYAYSNIENAFDCYEKCMNDANCGYVGLGFDCYDNCFNYFTAKDNDPLYPKPSTTIEKIGGY